VVKKVGGKSKIVFEPLPADDPTQRQPDITKVRAVTGWEPKVCLDDGLDRTIDYFPRASSPRKFVQSHREKSPWRGTCSGIVMRIWCLQHFEPEEAGLIGNGPPTRGHDFVTVRLYKGEALPKPGRQEALVVMGGPMNVDEDDRYPWLAPEKKLIAAHIAAGGRVFGVCLGGQLIARALGAPVTKNAQKEIGWHLVRIHLEARKFGPFKDFPETLTALQWHGDTFAIPPGPGMRPPATSAPIRPSRRATASSPCNFTLRRRRRRCATLWSALRTSWPRAARTSNRKKSSRDWPRTPSPANKPSTSSSNRWAGARVG
jgi:GMP synthase-like glutamine amidotransferase